MEMMKKIILICVLTTISFSNTYVFKNISLENKSEISTKFEKVKKEFLGTKMDNESIHLLLKKYNDKLKEDGYVTSVINIKDGNLFDGSLTLELLYGRIDKIYFSDYNDEFRNIKLALAFPNYKDRVLNTNYLDQGIENLTVGTDRINMEIVPSDKEGYSDIVIIKKREKLVNFSLSTSINSDSYKKPRLNARLNTSILNFLNDELTLSASGNIGEGVLKNRNESISLDYSINTSVLKTTYSASFDNIVNYTKSTNTNKDIVYTSRPHRHKFTLKANLYRTNKEKVVAKSSLEYKKNNTKIQDEKIDIQSKQYLTHDLDLNYQKNIENSQISLGLNWLTPFKIENDHKHFNKFVISFDYSKYFNVKGKSLDYRLLSSFGYVFGENILDQYKFSIGDDYSVRGYNSELGYVGAYINNTLTLNMNRYFSGSLGFDLGIIKNKEEDKIKNNKKEEIKKMASASMGLDFRYKGFSAKFLIAQPIIIIKDAYPKFSLRLGYDY